MAHLNKAFASDEYDIMDDDIHDSAEQIITSTVTNNSPKPSGCFTFVDFCPQYRRKPDSWFFQTEYETFRFVYYISTINKNLSQNFV